MITLNTTGPIYSSFMQDKDYPAISRNCIETTVSNLLSVATTSDSPGMLLGKIQSGKTRTFLGIIALAFDNKFDVAVVLTKGTKALAQQTYERLRREFSRLVNDDAVRIFDIMHFPDNLTEYEQQLKTVIVCKKEDDNIRRLETALLTTYPQLGNKRILIIDDEADFASIGFKRSKEEGVRMNKIAAQIDGIRKQLNQPSFLQVTATPYSLYLQPDGTNPNHGSQVFKPIRPAFTSLVPLHDRYVGGDYYFNESLDPESIAFFLHREVQHKELAVLKKQDGRTFKLEQSLESPAVKSIRDAVVTFIVGGCLRRIQECRENRRPKKFGFIVHTERGREAHDWQVRVVGEILRQFGEAAHSNNEIFKRLVRAAYDDLARSVTLLRCFLPPFEEILTEVKKHIPMVMIAKVNSENDVSQLLDDAGELQLRNPLNIFVGGQILDRGLTIGNLIGFFYGRTPGTFQQDTVLQHCRMYGVRPKEDLTVTRFFTTPELYSVMKKIHEFDTALRVAFERGGQDAGVVFIRKDAANRIIPCSPNKILLSSTTTLRPFRRLLPVGFETRSARELDRAVRAIDAIVREKQVAEDVPFFLDMDVAKGVVDIIADTFDFEDSGYDWDVKAFKACIEYLSHHQAAGALRGRVWCLAKFGRKNKRKRESERFENSPDTKQEKLAVDTHRPTCPILLLFRQNGAEEDGWSGHPFWWPVLMAPSTTETVVFASEIEEIE